MTAIHVLLVDDHTLVRAGIRALLQAMEGIEVVAEAGDGREALQLIETHRPDVALMDLSMAGFSGLDATARIKKEYPGVRVIMLSMHGSAEYVMQALRAGAAGYMLKDAATGELETAVRSVASGGSYISPALSKHVLEYLQHSGAEPDRPEFDPNRFERLTPRQREILQLIAEGHTTHEIAQTLNISAKTVETHRAQLMERLNIHDVPGLVRYALRIGLVPPD
ncbi:MAG TPA: response regulator transcription factor [Anaerolineae bacterium]|nr:response regulator transcription factor [Anaerolineae bacterium]